MQKEKQINLSLNEWEIKEISRFHVVNPKHYNFFYVFAFIVSLYLMIKGILILYDNIISTVGFGSLFIGILGFGILIHSYFYGRYKKDLKLSEKLRKSFNNAK